MLGSPSIVFTDPTASIQAAINALGAAGGTIYLSPGTFVLSTQLILPDFVTLQGSGFGATNLSATGVTALKDTDLILVQGNHCAIRDLRISGYEASAVAGVDPGISANTQQGIVVAAAASGLTDYNVNNFLCERVWFQQIPSSCVVMGRQSGNASIATHCKFVQCWISDSRANGSTAANIKLLNGTANEFNKCYVQNIHNSCVYVAQNRGLSFNDCAFEDSGFDTPTMVWLDGYNADINFNGCWWEKHGSNGGFYSIHCKDRNHSVNVRGCHFIQNDPDGAATLNVLDTVGTTSGGFKFTNKVSIRDCTCYTGNATFAADTAIKVHPDADATLDVVYLDHNLLGYVSMLNGANTEATLADWDGTVTGGFTKGSHIKSSAW